MSFGEALEAAEPSTDLPFAVIGMGKLGARELNVASDLDLMFVYEGEGSRRSVPPGNSPSGSFGPCAMRVGSPTPTSVPRAATDRSRDSIAGYLEYWQRYAETWEFKALL